MLPVHSIILLVLYIVGFLALALLLLMIVQRRARPAAGSDMTGDTGYRQLADEYQRLSELSVAAQARTDQRLEEITMQLGQLREQLDSVQRILKDVE